MKISNEPTGRRNPWSRLKASEKQMRPQITTGIAEARDLGDLKKMPNTCAREQQHG